MPVCDGGEVDCRSSFGEKAALLLVGLALIVSQAAGQAPSKEYIRLGGRVIAIENPPAAPTLSTATAGNAQVTLTWGAVAGATSYNLYRSTTAGGESNTPVVTGITTTSYTNTGLTNGQIYYYKVAAVNGFEVSAQSNEKSATPQSGGGVPPAPTNLTATAGNHQVGLTWNASSGATSYYVYQGTSAGGENAQPIATVTTTSYTSVGLQNGTKYYYKVAGVNTYGTGPSSNEASATPVCSPATVSYQNTTLGAGTYSACVSITVSPTVTINPGATLQIIQ